MPDMSTYRNRSFIAWCRRYISFSLIAIAGLLSYILFFTDNSVPDTYVYDREIEQKKNAIKAANDTLRYYQDLNRRLTTDAGTMEQVAREQYHMQRQGEDVYIIK